jgi:hypothetical protein
VDTGRSTADKGRAQPRTGSGDMANDSRRPSTQSRRTGIASPASLVPGRDRDDDRDPLLDRQPSSGTVNSGDQPSRAVDWDKQTHPGAHSQFHSPPSTEQDRPNQSTVGYVIVITKQSIIQCSVLVPKPKVDEKPTQRRRRIRRRHRRLERGNGRNPNPPAGAAASSVENR